MKKFIAILFVVLSLIGLSSCFGGIEFSLNYIVDGEIYHTATTNGKEIVKIPENPTKQEYIFDGWYLDEGEWQKPFTANSLLDTPISSNMEIRIYAKWIINPDEHTHSPSDWITDSNATCKQEGSKHKECTKCYAVLESATIEKLTTHTPAEAIKENFVDSDCESEGSYNSVVYCSICQVKLSSEAMTVGKKPHTPSDWIEDTAATCNQEGSKHKECTECEIFLESGIIEKLTTHQAGEGVMENFQDSDCSEEGSYNLSVYCTVCDKKLSTEQKTVEKKDHTPAEWTVEKQPDSTTDGLKVQRCESCGEKLDEEAIPMLTYSLDYEVNADGISCTITGKGDFDGTELIIPENISGYTVSAIGEYALGHCNGMISVIIPDTVAVIEQCAFTSNDSLIRVQIGSGVTEIGDSAFANCFKLLEICNGSQLNITAGSNNFGNIGKYAKNIYKASDAPKSKLKKVGDFVFYEDTDTSYLVSYIGSETQITLPENYNNGSYNIYNYALSGQCELLGTVTVPASVRKIGNYAFNECQKLSAIDIKDGVTYIGEGAFYNCTNLAAVILPNTLTELGRIAFYCCDKLSFSSYGGCDYVGNYSNPYYALIQPTELWVTEFTVHDDAVLIANSAFAYSDITNANITAVKYIGSIAFSNCDELASVTIGEGVEYVGSYAFARCSKLNTVTVSGSSVKKLGDRAFFYCKKLTTVSFNSVTHIGNYSFASCESLDNLRINGNVAKYAFSDCASLTSVTFDNATEKVDSYAFNNCSLTYISLGSGIKEIGANAFGNTASMGRINFSQKSGWRYYTDDTDSTGTEIPESSLSFYNATAFYKSYSAYCWKRTV